jgi:hypothetical protein
MSKKPDIEEAEMPFEEKFTWVNAVMMACVATVYFATVLPQARTAPVAQIAYQTPLLVAIGALIVLSILGAIATAITSAIWGEITGSGSEDVGRNDERDADIHRRGELVGYYVDHQVDVVTRRTQYELKRAEERDHIVQVLLIALANLDEVIKIIRGSQDADEARTKLMKKFKLSEIQANHILDMPLRRLTRLAREELEQEHRELLAKIRHLKALLKDPKKIRALIKDELLEVRKRFFNAR